MASSRDHEHFALDWIKSDLLETLNQARVALDEYAEQGADETRLRACLTNLHQLHGTLLMLELKGVTLLADHLEQAAQKLMLGDVAEPAACSQILMQGILEMPGFLDELQRGAEDKVGVFIPLVNDIRAQLGLEALEDSAGKSLNAGATDDSVDRFVKLDGRTKVARIRSAYQSVLLSILKGDDRAAAVATLAKIASGLQRLTSGSSMQRQWQAFGEFVNSLAGRQGSLESDAVKLLRKVDIEIKGLAAEGENALKRPANLELIQALLDATAAQDYESETVTGLREAVERDSSHNTLAISGRQAVATAALALSDELAVIKDKLDLLARAASLDLEALRGLTAPLKQIGSTLSLLGFESSREIVADQIEAVERIVVLGDTDPAGIQSVAAALIQIDENLNSVSTERTEIEQITGEAQLQLLRESSNGLDAIKSAVVDFVTAHWDVRHLQSVPQTFREICGALDIIPLPRVTALLEQTNSYVENKLLNGHQPDLPELDRFADVISGIDYFLERLAEENLHGMDDILEVAERSLEVLLTEQPEEAEAAEQRAGETDTIALAEDELEIFDPEDLTFGAQDSTHDSAQESTQESVQEEPEIDELEAVDADEETVSEPDTIEFISPTEEAGEVSSADEDLELTASGAIEADAEDEADELELSDLADTDALASSSEELAPIEFVSSDDQLTAQEAEEPQPDEDATEYAADESLSDDLIDETAIGEGTEVELQLEVDDAFDLSGDAFADLEGAIEQSDEPQLADSNEVLDEDQVEARDEEPAETLVELQEESQVEQKTPDHVDEQVAAEPQSIQFEGEPPDPEIVEIFLEEVDEVLETIDEWLPQWAQEPAASGEPITEVRRAFHTLKGSGRIVQALEIGDLAWGVENMLNRVIDSTVEPTEQFAGLVKRARDLVPELARAFEQMHKGDAEAIAEIIEQADLLASGGTLDASSAEAAEVELDSTLDAEHAAELHDTGEEVSVSELDDLAFVSDTDADADADTDVEEPEPAAEETELGDAERLFMDELTECIATLRNEQARTPWTLSEPLRRVLHTIAGGAAAIEAEQIRFIAGPANQVVEVYPEGATGDDLRAYFDAVVEQLALAQSQFNDQAWEEPVELVARADDLIAMALTRPNPVEALLNASATSVLFDSEPELLKILSGDKPGTELLSALTDFVRLAGEAEQSAVAELAAAVMRSVTVSTISGGVHAAAQAEISVGYNALLDQLNTLVTGGEVQSQMALVQRLDDIDFAESQGVQPLAPQPEAVEPESAADAQVFDAREVIDQAADELAEFEALAAEEADVDEAQTDASEQMPDLADLDIDADLVEVFFEEADEINEELETTIMDWSQEMENRLYLENILRGLHTLKGGARLCGLSHIGDMAHDFESLVITVQNNERTVDQALFKELHQQFDSVVEQLALVKAALFASDEQNVAEAQAETDFSVQADAGTDDRATEQNATTPLADASFNAESEKTAREAEQAAETAEDAAEQTQTPIAAQGPSATRSTQTSRTDEVLEEFISRAETQPPVSAVPPPSEEKAETAVEKVERPPQEMVRVGAGLLEELVNLAGENSILRARIEQGMSDFTGALDEMETTIDRLREQLRRLEIETETQVLYRRERDDGPQYEEFDPLEMDRYSQLQQLSRGLSESASDMLDLKDTLLFKARESETLLLQQARINTELQEGLMRTRMVPFNRLMPRLRRIVRQVAGELEKEVEFHVQNAEGELDRNLLERMVPPLEHMLRNAVDHGIELPDERRNFGKSAVGRIDLRLSREGGDVVIEISDDGAGIDVEGVRAKAIEKDLCTAEANLSDEEVMQFVLAPGFSTAKSVTQISGRGVGMDVVHSEVKQLGGSIHIASKVGKGTRFVLRVPFTVSVNRALMVSVAEDFYAIPLNTIEGIVLLSPDELDSLHNTENATFEYAGVPYRMRYLGQYLGREYRGPQVGQTSVPVVLVRSGDHAVAIHVDAVQGSREIVVKSLGPQFAGVGGISGATILGDGSVVVILDLHALIRAQRQFGKQTPAPLVGMGRPRCVLVVDDSVTVRKVTSRLLERQGMDVLVAKDGVEAVALLQERRPDVMLLDIEMPRMDGFEVARQVRHDDRLDSLPIVMISSRTGDKHKEHASQLGVNKFLGKPFQENELLATIDELVTRT
ncbi:MAG: Hpt domain-containing protein [Pseudomonadales bacterium]